jgi:xylulokinase
LTFPPSNSRVRPLSNEEKHRSKGAQTNTKTTHPSAIVVNSNLKGVAEAKVDFDQDFGAKYGIHKGVHVREQTGEVFAPVALWLESLDLVLERLSKAMPVPMSRIKGISGSGQQHGSVFWSASAEELLGGLDAKKPLVEQLDKALAHEFAPNWQDHSTQDELVAFDAELGNRETLAEVTGSGAHHVSCVMSSLPPSLSLNVL